MKFGFDNDLYISKQKKFIEERIAQFKGKLYLEFGGKLFDDYHASRVLPGFDVNGKIRLLHELRDMTEIIFCVSAADIEKTKVRADLGISYDMEVLRLIDAITAMDIPVNSVLITRYTGQSAADAFATKLTYRGVKNYIHRPINGYPSNIEHICSDAGYGSNPYIETTKPLVVVTAPGPGSGKLATCLSQVYHETKRGQLAGYAKFETFPIWNIPLLHPVNLAYEAATADLADVNLIDPFHLDAYGLTTVNYNRDVEAFPIVKTILSTIMQDDTIYKSPTDMGVNMAGYAICDNDNCKYAANQEIIRRYFKEECARKLGKSTTEAVKKIEKIMQQLSLKPTDRVGVSEALEKSKQCDTNASTLVLEDGVIITGKESRILSSTSACILNAIKHLAKIDDSITLISPDILEPILALKRDILNSRASVLKADDILIALSITAVSNETTKTALSMLPSLKGLEMHSSCMLHSGDEGTLRKLGINLTSEPQFPGKELFF